MEQVSDVVYKDLYGRLSAFLQKLYESAQQSEASIRRELHHSQQSRSEVAQSKVPQLERLVENREMIVCLLELILRREYKEELISHLPEEDRAWFEAVFRSPEGTRYANN
jgi:hypothetical protein